MKRILFIMLVSVFLLTACGSDEVEEIFEPSTSSYESEIQSMIFMAGYKPQANLPFVGVYVAQNKGYFEDEGLDVGIEHSAGQGEHMQLAATGKVQVTTSDAANLLQRKASPGLPLVSIALIGQTGQQAFAALTESGMETPADWVDHQVGYKGAPPPDLFALIDAAGITPNDIELVNVGFDPRLLAEGKVDVYPVFKSNEPFLLRSWGHEIILWDAASYGVPTLGLTYVTSEDTLKKEPEMLECFLRAALRGIEFASNNPDEAVEIVLKYAGPETNADHMRYMLETELEDATSEVTEQYIRGWQTEAQWQALEEMLWEREAIEARVDVNTAFSAEILEIVLDSE